MRPPIDPRWTFEEAVSALSGRYRPGGIASGPQRNSLIEAWAQAAGRVRAVRELEQAVARFGSFTAAARSLQMTPRTLQRFRELFARLPETFDPDEQEGLTLYFNTRVTPIDRFLVDGIIFGTLGLDTDCRIVEFKEQQDRAVLRLKAKSPKDLEAVADAIHDRIWETQESSERETLQRIEQVLNLQDLRSSLSLMREKLDRISLIHPDAQDDFYEQALEAIRHMATVMERSPASFASMGEEDLRQHFLVQLSWNHAGSATAETFNHRGKTDILVRKDGQNAFIAECKFWKGPEAFKAALAQLLGYATWRDKKLALLIFNRSKNLTHALRAIAQTLTNAETFVRREDGKTETEVHCILRHPEDPERELRLAVLVFEVPV